MTSFRAAMAGVVLACLLAGGCVTPPCPTRHASLGKLVDDYNANAAKVDRLWARVRWQVEMSDAKGRHASAGSVSPLSTPNGLLMLAKAAPGEEPGAPPVAHAIPAPAATSSAPAQTATASASSPEFEDDGPSANFVLIGKEAVAEVFRAGVEADKRLYYFWFALGKEGRTWYGRTELAGAPGGIQELRIDPLQLMEMLCVTPLPPVEPEAMPAVVMTLQNDPCAYVVRYLKPQPLTGHLKIWREVFFRWSDREPARPYQVKLYDADGLCRAVADVGDYRPIASRDPHPPVMPTSLRITWPAIRDVQPYSRLQLALSEMSTVKPFSDKAFDFWTHLPASAAPPTNLDEHPSQPSLAPEKP